MNLEDKLDISWIEIHKSVAPKRTSGKNLNFYKLGPLLYLFCRYEYVGIFGFKW